jgi:hypothetical protein
MPPVAEAPVARMRFCPLQRDHMQVLAKLACSCRGSEPFYELAVLSLIEQWSKGVERTWLSILPDAVK